MYIMYDVAQQTQTTISTTSVMYFGPWRSSIILSRPVAIKDHPTVGPWRSSIVLCRSFAVRDYPLSVHEDQSSSVVIHGRSVAIQYHPMSVREDQLVYTRGWDCQISRQDTDKQTSKTTRKITKFLDLGAQKHRRCQRKRTQQNTLTLKIARLACLEAGVFFLRSSLQPRSVALRFLRLNSVNP